MEISQISSVRVLVTGLALLAGTAVSAFFGSGEVSANHSSPVAFCRSHTVDGYARSSQRMGGPGRPDVAVRLAISKQTFSLGDIVYFRVQNIGATNVGLIGEAFVIQRYDEGTWTKDALTPDGFRRVRWGYLPPGKAGPCQQFALPVGTPAGRYRIRKEVLVGRNGHSKQLTVEFSVAS